jgi:hypothetical protein
MMASELVVVMGAGLCAAILMYRFRLFLRPRRAGESWGQFAERALKDREDYVAARDAVQGSRRATAVVNLINSCLLVGIAWLLIYAATVGWGLVAYATIGMYLAPRFSQLPARYDRLAILDRFNWRFSQTWLVPIRMATTQRKGNMQ